MAAASLVLLAVLGLLCSHRLPMAGRHAESSPAQSSSLVVPAAERRTVYPYSVIPGGAYSNYELVRALATDPVAAHHYQGFGLVDVKLSNNFGKKNTVVLFFPLAFTSVCTKEMCDLTAGLNAYQGLGADVIGISVDSPFAQEAWAQKEKIGITLASDLNKTVIKSYNVVFPMLAGVGDTAARAAFVIDKKGVVQYSEQTQTPKDLPNFDAIKAALAKLK